MTDVLCQAMVTTVALLLVLWGCTANNGTKDTGMEIRLVNGKVPWEGRVEVRDTSVNDTWGTVCHDRWEDVDATVACRQLGIGHRGTAKHSAFFGSGTGPIYLDNVECQGTEETLTNCRKNVWGNHYCNHSRDAGVICQPDLEVRLEGGRVEVRSPGLSVIWGGVCNDGWDNAAANVVCRQLGFGNRGVTKAHSSLGCSCRPVYLASVNCTGKESDLRHCEMSPWGSHNCQQGDQAGVVCERNCLEGTFKNNSTLECIPCPAGAYQSNSLTCQLCPSGTYQNGTGQTSCIPCPAGYYQRGEGAHSCTPCPTGLFAKTSGHTSCTPCHPGHYQNESGQSSCTSCPPGHYQNMSGQAWCTACSPGYYQKKTGQSFCYSCPPGSFQNEEGRQSCQSCPRGLEQQLEGQRACNVCIPGFYHINGSHVTCESCSPDSDQSSSRDPSCLPCFGGHSLCKVCPVGSYQSLAGQSSCVACRVQTTTSTLGADHPENCTASPVPVPTIDVKMPCTLVVNCSDKVAVKVNKAVSSRVYQLEAHVNGVCADLLCSNTLVKTWCDDYDSLTINIEIQFQYLPLESVLANGTNIKTEELLLQTLTKVLNISDVGAFPQIDKGKTKATTPCPPNFHFSGPYCVYKEDEATQLTGITVGSIIAVVGIIFLVIILWKLKKRSNTSVHAETGPRSPAAVYHKKMDTEEAGVYCGNVVEAKADDIYSVIPT